MPESPATIGKYPSSWVVLARRESDLGGLIHDPRWRRLQPVKKSAPWTDSYSNILDVLNWF